MSARKLSKNVISGILIMMAVAMVGLIAFVSKNPPGQYDGVCIKYGPAEQVSKYALPKAQCELSLEKVDTESKREQGLSGRADMPSNRGMLFIFDNIGRQCIWMKGMKFPLDILWLDARGTVIKVEQNLAPNTYPAEYCADNTSFVIEVNSGVSKVLGLGPGSHINL